MAPPSATASTPRRGRPPASTRTWRRRTPTRPNLLSTIEKGRRMKSVAATSDVTLELDDIQAGALYERPSPYVGTYLLLRIADRADGRELVRRLHGLVNPAGAADTPDGTSITVAFTYHGLEALGVPKASLDSFAPEFREGMVARAATLNDV